MYLQVTTRAQEVVVCRIFLFSRVNYNEWFAYLLYFHYKDFTYVFKLYVYISSLLLNCPNSTFWSMFQIANSFNGTKSSEVPNLNIELIKLQSHYSDVIMGAMSSQITSLTVVYTTVYSDVDQRKHQRSAPLAFVWGIHRWPVNSSQKMVNNTENVSICWRHHEALLYWAFPRVNVTRPDWWLYNIGKGNGLVTSGSNPLPKPSLTLTHVNKGRH